MEPSDWTLAPIVAQTNCAQCEAPLTAGRRWCCCACERAAELAIRELPGQTVTPSMIAAARERLQSS